MGSLIQVCRNQAISTNDQPDIESMDELDYNRQSTYSKLTGISAKFLNDINIRQGYNSLIQRIFITHQTHLIKLLKESTEQERIQLINAFENVYFEMIDSLYHQLKNNKPNQQQIKGIMQIENYEEINQKLYYQIGLNLIRDGRVGFVLLAGGKSSRFQDQKATTSINYTSLLQLLFERLKKILSIAQEKDVNSFQQFPIAMILNEHNSYDIKVTMRLNNHFNFDPDLIQFSYQKSLPILYENGQITFSHHFQINTTPNGTGNVFPILKQINFLEKWLVNNLFFIFISQNKKIDYIHIIGIENLAGLPLDPLALGLLHSNQKQLLCKITDTKMDFAEYMTLKDRSLIFQNQPSQDIQTVCLNDIYIRTDFIPSLSQQQCLTYASQQHLINRQSQIYSHSLKNHESSNTLQFEQSIHDIIPVATHISFFKIPSQEYLPIVLPLKQINPLQNYEQLQLQWKEQQERTSYSLAWSKLIS